MGRRGEPRLTALGRFKMAPGPPADLRDSTGAFDPPALPALSAHRSVPMSFTDMSLLERTYSYVGFAQYVDVLTAPGFWTMARVTAIRGRERHRPVGAGHDTGTGDRLHGSKNTSTGSVSTRVAVLGLGHPRHRHRNYLATDDDDEAPYGVLNYFPDPDGVRYRFLPPIPRWHCSRSSLRTRGAALRSR